jgi:uncharacterized protein (TIGR02145 family)
MSALRTWRLFAAIAIVVSIASCRQDSTTSPDSAEGRNIAMRIDRGADIPDSLWFRTDSVRIRISTTSGIPLLDKSLPFTSGSLAFGTVSAPGDQGVLVDAIGYDRGVETWTASQTLPPSSSPQVAVLRIGSAKATSNPVPSFGTATAPFVVSISDSTWPKDTSATGIRDAVTSDRPFRVFLGSLTDSVTIRYSLDGSNPSMNSPAYDPASGILVDSSRTLQAIATREGWNSSSIFAVEFALRSRRAAVVSSSISPWAVDTFDQPVVLSLASPTPQARIHYTLDGSVPTESSPLYGTGGIFLDTSCRLTAVVFAGKNLPAAVNLSRNFVLKARPPVVAPSAREGLPPFRTALASTTPGCIVRYTRNGRIPTLTDSIYQDSLLFAKTDDSTTITAVAFPIASKIAPSPPTVRRVGWAIPWNPAVKYSSFMDPRDQRVYRSVRIANKVWMAENLDFKGVAGAEIGVCPGANGSRIPGSADSCSKYGRLYTWRELMAGQGEGTFVRGLCPVGWRLANLRDWDTLIATAESDPRIGPSFGAQSLRSVAGWTTGTIPGLDLLGFRAVAPGFRYANGMFSLANQVANWWLPLESDPETAYQKNIDYLHGEVFIVDFDTTFAFSGRCVLSD